MLLRILDKGGYRRSSKALYRCDNCQIEFERDYHLAQRKRSTHFCTQKCANLGRAKPKRFPKNCKACDQQFMGLALSLYCKKCFLIRGTCSRRGITQKQRHDMFTLQNEACAICHDKTRELVIDHDHQTDVVRGLLCRHCNSVLGMVERPIWLKSALDYLQRHSS